jgi:hypothetical protein
VNLDSGEKLAEYAKARLYPQDFAREVYQLARWFHDAIVSFEINGPGASFRKALQETHKYGNFYMRKKSERSLSPKMTLEPGWNASPENKVELMTSYRGALSTGKYCNRSSRALEELRHFVYDGNTVGHALQILKDSPSGAGANHGDLGWSDAFAWLLIREYNGAVMKEGSEVAGTAKAPIGSPAWWREQDESQDDNEGWGRD